MNALQTPQTLKNPPRKPRQHPQWYARRRLKTDRAVAIEITIKLVANAIVSAVAIAALIRLLPYQSIQQANLQELRDEVQETEALVNDQRQDFSRYFDPIQAKKVMQQQNPRLDPNQRRIILTKLEEAPPSKGEGSLTSR
ncbi:MAG: hypothetical protein IGR93_05820 [Hydrococcus sp. C42_A2020_068]|nr:hypothetical protein [Hydrococcus sp. C42_A2020_068]